MKKTLLLVLAILLLVPMLVFAQEPKTVNTGDYGLEIRHPPIVFLDKGESHTFNFHVFNRADGLPITAGDLLNCTFHLYSDTGSHLYIKSNNKTDHNFDYEFFIDKGNFSYVGEYAYIMQCNGTVIEHIITAGAETSLTATRGGFVSHHFIVNEAGEEFGVGEAIGYSVFLFLMITLMLVCLIWAFNINGNDTVSMGDLVEINYKKYAKFFLYFMSYLFFVLSLFFAWQISYLFLLDSWANGIFRTLFRTSWFALFPITVGWIVLMIVKFITDLKIDKMVKRGLPPRSGA